MANTRFGIVNAIGDAVVTNGDGTGPVRTEISPYVMERAMDGDRYSLWVPDAANQDSGFTWEITLDFGTSKSFTMMAALGVEGDSLTSVKAGRYVNYATGAKEEVSLARNGRDWGASFTSMSSQYWYFNFFAFPLKSVGDLFIGAVKDLGVVGIPNFTTSPFRIRTEQPQTDGSVVLNESNLMGHEFEMEFYARDLTELATYESLIANPGSVILLDERNRTFEVLITGGQLPTRRQFKGYRVTLSMRRQP